jgi:hypothetical protein
MAILVFLHVIANVFVAGEMSFGVYIEVFLIILLQILCC